MYYGEKVCLRAYREEDIPIATKFVNDGELKKLLAPGIPFPMTLWEEEEWVKLQKGNKNGEYNFAIEDIETNNYIGGCGINEVNWTTRIATIGIMVGDKNYWNKGYGTDAMKVLMKFIFDNMNIRKIKLNVYRSTAYRSKRPTHYSHNPRHPFPDRLFPVSVYRGDRQNIHFPKTTGY